MRARQARASRNSDSGVALRDAASRTPPCRACGRSRPDPRRRAGTGTRAFLPSASTRQRVLQRAPRGLAARGVAVEAEHDGVGQPEQLLHVHRRGRGAERRHRVLDAVLRQRDDVHVALDDDDAAGVADRVARQEQAVELAALREQRRFRRVQVLGLAVAEHAAAEADHAAAAVVDREHDRGRGSGRSACRRRR